MKILFTTTATLSHFRPQLPLARVLKARGHDVRFGAIARFADEIVRRGFEHVVMDGPTDEVRAAFARQVEGAPLTDLGRIYTAGFYLGILAESSAPSLLRALDAWRPDLIVRGTMEFGALVAAERLGIRCVRLEILNGASEERIGTESLEELNGLRERLSLAPSGPGYLARETCFTGHPQVLDGTPRVNTASPLRYLANPAQPIAPPDGDWMASGQAPFVYATFGTVAAAHGGANAIYRVVMEALADLPARVLFTTGRDAPENLFARIPENVTVRPFVPQTEVLPHARLLVCHGGSGTVIAGLAQGVPMVIAPLFSDQPENAAVLSDAGICASVPDADAGTLRRAIEGALGDAAMLARARSAAAGIAAMPSVEEAVDVLLTD